jgi:hypothetical protein
MTKDIGPAGRNFVPNLVPKQPWITVSYTTWTGERPIFQGYLRSCGVIAMQKVVGSSPIIRS